MQESAKLRIFAVLNHDIRLSQMQVIHQLSYNISFLIKESTIDNFWIP